MATDAELEANFERYKAASKEFFSVLEELKSQLEELNGIVRNGISQEEDE